MPLEPPASDAHESKGDLACITAEDTELAKSFVLTPALMEKMLTSKREKRSQNYDLNFLQISVILSSTLDDHEYRISFLESSLTDMLASLHKT